MSSSVAAASLADMAAGRGDMSGINWSTVTKFASDQLGMDRTDAEGDPTMAPRGGARKGKSKTADLKKMQEAQALAKSPFAFETYASQGDMGGVVLMWAQGVDVNRRIDIQGTAAPALMWAALKGKNAVVRFLLDQGADVNQGTADGQTPLMWATNECHVDTVHLLLQHGADPRTEDDRGYSAATVAVQSETLACLVALHEHTPVDAQQVDKERHTLATWAAYRGATHILEYVHQVVKVSLNAVDIHGRTPLHWAAREGNPDSSAYLIRHSVSVTAKDNEGATALEYAQSRNHREATQIIAAQQPHVDDRCVGTLRILTTNRLCLISALSGVAFSLLCWQFLLFFPPMFAYPLAGVYLSKNIVISSLMNRPERNTVGEKSIFEEMGMPSTVHGALRGIGLLRRREPANLFIFLTVLGVQFLVYQHSEFPVPSLYFPLLVLVLGLLFVTKMSAFRSGLPNGELKDSPVVKAVRDQQFHRINDYAMDEEHHVRLPLRAAYCIETDSVFERYDSFSVLLDAPIAQSNHLFFILFLMATVALQCVIGFGAWHHMKASLCEAEGFAKMSSNSRWGEGFSMSSSLLHGS